MNETRLIVDIVGWTGSLAVVIAYALISWQKIHANTLLYQGLNIVGSIGLIVNTFYWQAYPSLFVNLVWVLIGLLALRKIRQ